MRAGTIDNAAVIRAKLLHTEDGDDILQFAVTLQQLLCAACGLVMPLADNIRFEDTRGGIQRVNGRIDALLDNLTGEERSWRPGG